MRRSSPPKTRLRSRRWLVQTSEAKSGERDTFTVLSTGIRGVPTTVFSKTHRDEGMSCMSMVEPKEVALQSGESLSPADQQSCMLTPIEVPKNEWKRSVVTGRMNGNHSSLGFPRRLT